MPVEWSEELELGCPEIDGDHREILDLLNRVQEAVEKGETGRCAALLTALVGFAKRHFAREEEILAEVDYPKLEAHAATHRELLNQIWALLGTCSKAAGGGGKDLCLERVQAFIDADILGSDQAFKTHLQAHKAARCAGDGAE